MVHFFLFHRTQSRICSPVSPQHTAPSRTVRRYPASNGQLTSNALPNGNGHEQSSYGPHAFSQEHTLSARGKASRAFTLFVAWGGPKKPRTLRTVSLGGMEREGQHGHCRGLAENETLPKKDRSGEQNADGRGEEPGGCDRCPSEVLNITPAWCLEGGFPVCRNGASWLPPQSEQPSRLDCATNI